MVSPKLQRNRLFLPIGGDLQIAVPRFRVRECVRNMDQRYLIAIIKKSDFSYDLGISSISTADIFMMSVVICE